MAPRRLARSTMPVTESALGQHLPEAVVVRPAATVVLVRDAVGEGGRSGLQVFMQRRVAAMAFAAGMSVFPGGGVDQSDLSESTPWRGPERRWWADRFKVTPELAGALVHAAVRETFEECGVLLSDDAGAPLNAAWLIASRARLLTHDASLAGILANQRLQLCADLLRPWARWITPPGGPRRYDTAFFIAVLPAGQAADAHTTEAEDAAWCYPRDALAQWKQGVVKLMPPTIQTLQEISAFSTASDLLAASGTRSIEPITR